MASINQYSTVDVLSGGDLMLVWSTGNSDTRKTSVSALLTYMQDNLTFSDGKQEFTKQFFAPSATGFSVSITDNSDNTWLILTPDAGYAAGTIVLPSLANLTDKQEVLVNCTEAVTTLTIDANGATSVIGAPTGLLANDFFKLKYDSSLSRWYRIG